MDKQAVLREWISCVKCLPKQGSVEWLNGRKFRIGGSEIGTIEGTNHFQNIKSLVASHIGLTSFNGNTATRWGNIMEDVTVKLLEKIYACDIYVPGSILHDTVDVHANSADGVAYIKAWDAIVLFEIKNPISRIPGRTIPPGYRSQIKSGLCTIKICDFALFVDTMQRKCALGDLVPNIIYDTSFHNPTRDKVKNGGPMVLTMLGIYTKTPYVNDDDVFDYGMAGKDMFDDILLEIQSHTGTYVHYGDIYVCDSVNKPPSPHIWYMSFIKYCTDNNFQPIGVLPLKIFKVSIVPLQRVDNYIENMAGVMYDVVDVIKKLDGLDPDTQLSKLDELYPDSYLRY